MKTKTTQTPGPWEITQGSTCQENGAEGWTVGQETDHDEGLHLAGDVVATHIPTEADARLIAAAPELLDALKAFQRGEVMDDDAVNALIAKAEGK